MYTYLVVQTDNINHACMNSLVVLYMFQKLANNLFRVRNV